MKKCHFGESVPPPTKKQYLEVDYTFGVASIRLPMLGLVAKTLVWPNVHNLRIEEALEIF